MTVSMFKADSDNTVLGVGSHSQTYMLYGYSPCLRSLMGYKGEYQALEHYMLGSYRVLDVRLMVFQSPDAWSPFGQGGLNAYGFGGGNPTGGSDPTGHVFLAKTLGIKPKTGITALARKTGIHKKLLKDAWRRRVDQDSRFRVETQWQLEVFKQTSRKQAPLGSNTDERSLKLLEAFIRIDASAPRPRVLETLQSEIFPSGTAIKPLRQS